MHLVQQRNLVSVSRYHGNRPGFPLNPASSGPIVHPAVGQADPPSFDVSRKGRGTKGDKKGKETKRKWLLHCGRGARRKERGRGKFHGENRHGPVQVKSRESGQFPWHRPANPRRSFRLPTEFSPQALVAWIEEG